MKTDFEQFLLDTTNCYRAGMGLPPVGQKAEGTCIRTDCTQEDFAGGLCYKHWRESTKFDRDDYEPDYQDENERLDDPRHAQCVNGIFKP